MTERELLNRLVSAFWALDEMGDISLDASSGSGESAANADNRREWFRDDPDQGTGSSGSAVTDGTETPEPEPSKTESSDPFDTDDLDPRDELSSTEVELTRRIAELRRQIADLSLDVEQQRSRQDEYTDRLSDDITRLHSQIQSLDSRLEQADGDVADRVDAVEATLGDVEATLGDVEATQSELETWIDEEFDQIEALFERILGTVREFDDRIEALESTVDTVSDAEQDRETLDTLRRQAVRKGIDTGRCENCETAVDLSMLSSPICPSCDEPFRDIEDTASWNPFSKPTLRTGDRLPRPPHRD